MVDYVPQAPKFRSGDPDRTGFNTPITNDHLAGTVEEWYGMASTLADGDN